MKKFILLTFGFLTWAFYEMSGGAHFEPASQRMAQLAPAVETKDLEGVTSPTETVFAQAEKPLADTTPPPNDSVTRVSLNLTTLKEVQAPDNAPATAAKTAAVVGSQDATGVPINVGASLSSADTPPIMPSLIRPNDTGAAVQTVSMSSSQGDIRTVTGNTVNVRGGPGTKYGVVSKLNRGDAVEVLLDDGSGWVKMRPLDGGAEGWMADFLLNGG